MQTIAFILGFFIFGFVAKQFLRGTDSVIKWINTYIIYIALPSIILLKIPTLEFSAAMLIPAGFAWFWALLGGALMLAISRYFQLPKPLEGAALLLTILGNVSFLGYPMIQAFFNDEVLSYAIFYDQLGCFLILCTAGIIIIGMYGPQVAQKKVSIIGIALKIISSPPMIALLVASFLPIEALVTNAEPVLNVLAKSLMPLALMAIGLQFQPQLLPEHRLPLTAAISLKMLIGPFLAFTVVSGMNVATPIAQATIFQAAMPCMITPGIMAIQAGLAPRFCATLLGYSTLLSFIWLPILAIIIS